MAKDVTVTYVDGSTVQHLVKTSACVIPGDSGGPFLWGHQAQGVTSGGTLGQSCPGSIGVFSYYYPLSLIMANYGLALTVAPPGTVPPVSPINFSVTFRYTAGKYRFTASWSTSPTATSYVLTGHYYGGPATNISWTVPENYEDLSIEYYVSACNSFGCSPPVGPVTAQWTP